MTCMNVTRSHGSALIRTAMETTRQIAGRWARSDLSELPRDMVTLTEQKHSVSIGVALIRTADEMEGTLVDLLA